MELKKQAMLAAAALAVLAGPFLRAQAPAPPPGTAPAGEVVVGSGNFSPMLQDLDKAIDFYGGLLGLTVPPPPASGERPLNTDPNLLGMFGMPGAQLRFVTARIPGATVGVEMVEVRGLDKKAMHPRPQDAGSSTLILLVRDVDAALAPLKKAGVAVVTAGGQPVALDGNKGRAVLVNDPDGHFVELRQPNPLPETTAPAGGNVIGARVRFAVADTEKTMRVYRDTLQIKPQIGEFSNGPLIDLMGLKGAQARLSTLQVPGSPLQLEFVEVKGAPGTPIHPNLQDPGATRLQLRLRDLEGTIARMKAAGSTVISSGGQPASLNGGTKAAIMTDPNGIYLVMIQAPPPRA